MENIKIPTTTREAFEILDSMIDVEDKAAFLSQSKSGFIAEQHFSLGMWIRDTWIFGSEEENAEARERRKKCLRMLAGVRKGDDPESLEDLLIGLPDIISDQFLHRYYDHLKRTMKKSIFFPADKD